MRPQPALVIAALSLAIVACDNMANQPKRLPYELPAGKTAEPNWPALPPAGIVARDDRPVPMPPLTLALIERGRERFDFACAPCHGRAGGGHGMILPRRFPAIPPFTSDRPRAAAVADFYHVVRNGWRALFAYAKRLVR